MSASAGRDPAPTRTYWGAAAASLLFPLAYLFGGLVYALLGPVLATALLDPLVLFVALYVFQALRSLLGRRPGGLAVGRPAMWCAWGLGIHLITMMVTQILFGHLALIETDWSRAGIWEWVLALLCLAAAYLTGGTAILLGRGLARLGDPLLGLRRWASGAFWACGLLMSAYSLAVTLRIWARPGLVDSLAAVAFYLTDLSFIVVCMVLTLLFFRASTGRRSA